MAEKAAMFEVERALLRVVRSLGKRRLGRSRERDLESLVNLSHVVVVDALGERDDHYGIITVGQIARRVELDHSRASRMVAAAIGAGYAKRVASQDDGRRTCVALTGKGEECASAIRALRHKFFAAHLKGWSDSDCREFARLLTKFARSEKPERTESGVRGGNVVTLHPAGKRRRRAARARS